MYIQSTYVKVILSTSGAICTVHTEAGWLRRVLFASLFNSTFTLTPQHFELVVLYVDNFQKNRKSFKHFKIMLWRSIFGTSIYVDKCSDHEETSDYKHYKTIIVLAIKRHDRWSIEKSSYIHTRTKTQKEVIKSILRIFLCYTLEETHMTSRKHHTLDLIYVKVREISFDTTRQSKTCSFYLISSPEIVHSLQIQYNYTRSLTLLITINTIESSRGISALF